MKRFFLTVCFLPLGLLLSAQELTLKTVLEQIEQQHPMVQMYNFEANAMDIAALGAKNWMPPQLSFGTFMTPYSGVNNIRNGMMDMSSMMLSVQQMFPNRAYQKAKMDYMQQFSKVTLAQKDMQLNVLRKNAKETYYNLLVQLKREKIWDENQKILELMLQNIEKKYKNGFFKLNMYYKAKAALGEIKNQQLQLHNDINNAKIKINTLMNRAVTTPFEIDTALQVDFASISKIDTLQLFAQKSEFKLLTEKATLNNFEIVAQKKQLRPEWGVNFGHMQPLANGAMTRFSAMLMVSLPIFSWTKNTNKANIQKLYYNNKALEAQKDMLWNQIEGEAKALQNDINLLKEQLKLYENEIIPAYLKSYQATMLGFEQNTEDISIVYENWQKLYDTQSTYLKILSDLYKKQVAYDYLIENR